MHFRTFLCAIVYIYKGMYTILLTIRLFKNTVSTTIITPFIFQMWMYLIPTTFFP